MMMLPSMPMPMPMLREHGIDITFSAEVYRRRYRVYVPSRKRTEVAEAKVCIKPSDIDGLTGLICKAQINKFWPFQGSHRRSLNLEARPKYPERLANLHVGARLPTNKNTPCSSQPLEYKIDKDDKNGNARPENPLVLLDPSFNHADRVS